MGEVDRESRVRHILWDYAVNGRVITLDDFAIKGYCLTGEIFISLLVDDKHMGVGGITAVCLKVNAEEVGAIRVGNLCNGLEHCAENFLVHLSNF